MPKLEIANKPLRSSQDIRSATWYTWDTRMPNVKAPLRAIDLYNKSGVVCKSDFVRTPTLEEHLKVIMVDKSAMDYYQHPD